MARLIVYQGHQWTEEEFRKYVGDPRPHLKGLFVTGVNRVKGKNPRRALDVSGTSNSLYVLAHESRRVVKIGFTTRSASSCLRDYIQRH